MRLLLLLLLIFAPLFASEQQGRVALLIANSEYEEGTLLQVETDQYNLKIFLESKGFDVLSIKNATKRESIKTIREFERRLIDSKVALFYYGGQSVSLDADNYLIPYDSSIDTKESIKKEAIPLSKIVDIMREGHNQTNILLLDLHTDAFKGYSDQSGKEELKRITLLSTFNFYIHFTSKRRSPLVEDFITLYGDTKELEDMQWFTKRYIVHISSEQLFTF